MKRRRGQDPRLALDDILLFHILPKLPIKSLIRFKCVCKKWRRWVSRDPTFIREQSRISLSSHGIAFMGHSGLELISTGAAAEINVPDPSLKFLKGSNPRLEAACNGLLCVSFDQPRGGLLRKVYVCNPVTREWTWIQGGLFRDFFGLAFDPLDSPQVYKLVCLCTVKNSKEVQFEVFSSDTKVWTVSEKKVETEIRLWRPTVSVFAGGTLYWNVGTQFVWYDPHRDLAGVFMLPSGRDMLEPLCNYALGAWEDRLTYTGIRWCEMEAWVMSEFKWIRICHVDLDNSIRGMENSMDYIGRWKRKCILPYQGGEFLYFAGEDGMEAEVMIYNMKTGELTKSRACGSNAYRYSFTYNNSFVRLPRLSKRVSKIN